MDLTLFSTLHDITTVIAVIAITIFTGFIIAKLAGRITKKILSEAELNRVLVSAGFTPLSDVTGTIVEYVIYVATVLFVLRQFGLAGIAIWTIAAILGLALITAIVLALRDFVPNAIIGLLWRGTLKNCVGKKVKIGSVSGTLVRYNAVASIVKSKDTHYVPHMYTSKNKIIRLREG